MPRLTKALPKYRKHKASGQAIVTLDGTDFYLGPHGTQASRDEYDRHVGKWQQNGRRLPPKSEQVVTVTELLAAYWKFAKSYYVKKGKPTDEVPGIRVALRYVRQSYGDSLVTDFGPLSLENIQDNMTTAGHCRRYVNQNIGRIKRCFKWGVSKELVPVEAYQALATVAGLRKGKTEARDLPPVLPVEDSVVEATLPFLPRVVQDMIRLQRLTGCRPEEVTIIRSCDVDRSGDVWRYVPEEHKTEHHDKTRVIFLGSKAQAILGPYLLREESLRCFKTPRGRPFSVRNYREHIHRACAKAFPGPADATVVELKAWQKEHRWNPNQLRHAAATEIRKEFGLEAAQVMLGHSNADTTQIYAERDLQKAAEVARQVG